MKQQIIPLALLVLLAGNTLFVSGQNTLPANGRVGIGTTTPNTSAILDIDTIGLGVLVPRMTKIQRDGIGTPAEGLLIYQKNSTPGFYYYDGGNWKQMSPKGVNKSLDNLTSTAINQSLLPEATGTLDLGSAAFRWRDTYTNSVRYSDATIQTTALPYTAGAGISIAGNIISNTGLIAETDPQVGLNTTNYVPKWDGSALVTGSIFDNGRIGIGTASPSYKVQVENSTDTRSLYLVNNYSTTSVKYGIYNSVTTGDNTKYGIYNTVVNEAPTLSTFGLYSTASGSGSGSVYGLYSFVSAFTGTGTHYGLYSSASGAENYALYGVGRGYFSEDLIVGDHIRENSGSGDQLVELHSEGGSKVGLRWIRETATYRDYELVGDGGYLILNSSLDDFGTQTEVMRINGSNGYVGLGTTSLSYKLNVCGTIRANEVRVDAGWCDYVFDAKYKLMPLEELQQFINANKHLPNIPPASEVETNGLPIGEMTPKMMEKIEELTLYVLALNERMKVLEQENESLRKHITNLK